MKQVSRVLVLCKDFNAPGGVANFVRSILQNLPASIEATQLSIGRPTGQEGLLAGLTAPIRDNFRLIRHINRLKPDCVHLNPSLNWSSLLRDGLFLIVLHIFGMANVLVFFHGWRDADAERIKNSALLRWLFLRTFGRVPVICVLASRFKDTLIDIGVSEKNVSVTTTMFDARNFENLSRRRDDDTCVLTFMGRLVKEKGIFEIIQAYAKIHTRFPASRLLIAGDGPALADLETEVQELGISDHVHFTGYITGTEKAQLLLDSDIFVFPTYYPEGCPVSLLEAMAAGLPVITSTAGGIPDILVDGEHGVLMRDINSESVAQEIETLLSNPKMREQMANKNHDYAWREFQPSAVVDKIVKFYNAAATHHV